MGRDFLKFLYWELSVWIRNKMFYIVIVLNIYFKEDCKLFLNICLYIINFYRLIDIFNFVMNDIVVFVLYFIGVWFSRY